MIDIQSAIIDALPKGLLLDLLDRTTADALTAHEVVRDHFTLNPKRSREAVGQIRFRLQEQGFEEVVQKHGGIILDDDVMPGTNLKIFQPFARFSGPKVGVILGFASMPEPGVVPHKNQSRAAGVTVNLHLQPRLDLDGSGPRMTDIFVLFLVARDRIRAGMIEEVAVGVVDADYKDYLFYRSLEAFLTEFDTTAPPSGDGGRDGSSSTVKLRQLRKPYVPPEKQLPAEKIGDGTED